jgi:hypothetical protein
MLRAHQTTGANDEKSYINKDSSSEDLPEGEALVAEFTQKPISYLEPDTHIKNKSFGEKFCPSFSCVGKTKLTHDELISFHKLKEDANITFTRDSQEYDHLLQKLWSLLSDQPLHTIEDERWKTFGFQNANPRSDFRGGGLLSLKQMVYFCFHHQKRVLEMSKPEHQYLFAVSSINVTFFLIKYYHMAEDISFPRDKRSIASRKALKSFCMILDDDEELLNRIHSFLTNELFEIWLKMEAANPKLSLMDFPQAFGYLKKKYIKVTKRKIYKDLGNLIQSFIKVKSPLPK